MSANYSQFITQWSFSEMMWRTEKRALPTNHSLTAVLAIKTLQTPPKCPTWPTATVPPHMKQTEKNTQEQSWCRGHGNETPLFVIMIPIDRTANGVFPRKCRRSSVQCYNKLTASTRAQPWLKSSAGREEGVWWTEIPSKAPARGLGLRRQKLKHFKS